MRAAAVLLPFILGACAREPSPPVPEPKVVVAAAPALPDRDPQVRVEPWLPFDPVFKGCEGG